MTSCKNTGFVSATKEGSAILLALALTAISAIVVMNVGQVAVTVTRSAADDGVQKGKDLFRALVAGSIQQRATAALFICDQLDKPGANCETRFDLGRSAEVSYLFKRQHLSDWQSIDAKVKDLIKSFRSAARIVN